MPKANVTSVETSRFNTGMMGLHQVCALLIALEHGSTEMESDDVAAAIAGINHIVRGISMDMDYAMLEGSKNV